MDDIEVPIDDDLGVVAGDESIEIVLPDGSVSIQIGDAPREPEGDAAFDDNLADYLSEEELSGLAVELIRAIENDDNARQEWLNIQQEGVKLLGYEIEKPSSGTASGSTAVQGMSTIRHPILAEAVNRFHSTSLGELLPADGPVKVRIDGRPTPDEDVLANALQRDMNHYLTAVATEYYPDTDNMLFWVGLSGSAFKKIYHDPIRRRPVSVSVEAKDMILSPDTKPMDLYSGSRRTHRIKMRQAVLRRMQLVGAYRDIEVPVPSESPTNALEEETSQVSGVSQTVNVDDTDREYDILECYCELDLPGFEHVGDDGEKDGLPVPYKVVIERSSQLILEIRRNYAEDDDLCLPKQTFVQYVYTTGIGPYGIGLTHMLANTAMAATAGWREGLDAGLFANFPGFIYAKGVGRQNTSDFTVPPGGGIAMDTGGLPLRDAIMPLPYKEMGPSMMALINSVIETGQRVGGTAEMATGNGNSQAPVGTTMALIEQAQVVTSAVHRRLHQAQSREFQLLRDRFREDPESFYRYNRGHQSHAWDKAEFIAALNHYDIVPSADPNTAGAMQRAMKAAAVLQLAQANPDAFNMGNVLRFALASLNVGSPETLLNVAGPVDSGPSPVEEATIKAADARVMTAQASLERAVIEREKMVRDDRNKDADRELDREKFIVTEGIKLAGIGGAALDQTESLEQSLIRQSEINQHIRDSGVQ